MNASPSTILRALHGLGSVALLLTLFEACSGSEANPPKPPDGPASIEITGIALGQGFYGDGGASSVLSCDKKIGVNVRLTNWTLVGPGRCAGALQCGQLRVTLVEKTTEVVDGVEKSVEADVLQIVAAGNGVALDGDAATPAVHVDGTYYVRAELIDDAGHPYIEIDGGNGTANSQDFEITDICPASGAGGNHSGGTAGSDAIAGSGGTAGTAGGTETAGVGGTAGTAGGAEIAGIGGTAGTAGGAETAGVGGTAGTAGGSEIGGLAGFGGTAGGAPETAGTAGTTAGNGGTQ